MAQTRNAPARQQTQQPQTQQGKRTNLPALKSILNMDEMKRRFSEILGQKAPQFMASITNAVSTNDYLQKCDAGSVIQSALIAATYDLPIDGNLGFAAIVPYGDKAQFQMMYKGFIQLAIRSGEYKDMNVSEVYADELKSYNPITGQVTFVDDFTDAVMRYEPDAKKRAENVVGYYAWFQLNKGFSHGLYMTKAEVEAHARKYSQAYQRDLNKGWTSSRWSLDFDAMAKKTVIKMLLSKWGILSIDMQGAIQDDQKVYDADGNGVYIDNPETEAGPEEVVDVFAENTQQALPENTKQETPAPEPQAGTQTEFDWGNADDSELPWN